MADAPTPAPPQPESRNPRVARPEDGGESTVTVIVAFLANALVAGAKTVAATKPQVLGLILVLLGLSLRLRSWGAVATLALVVIFQLLTSPVAAHMVGRAGYRTGKVRTDLLVVDELTRDQDAAEREDVGEHESAGSADRPAPREGAEPAAPGDADLADTADTAAGDVGPSGGETSER